MAIPSRQYQIPAGTLGSLGPINPAAVQTANTGVTGGMAPGGAPASGDQSLAGMSPEQQYWAAVHGLGWNTSGGNQYRGQQQQLVDYMAQHGAPGWQSGGTKADDWMKDPTGGTHDMITSGGQLVFNPDDPTAGTGGVGGAGFSGNLMDDPGYQFQLGEGLKALQRSAAARGTLLTGGTLKGLQGYAQDYANTAYQNAFNRNMGVAQLGMGAANSLANLGSSYGNAASGLYGQLGNAQAAGTVGKTNPWLGAMGEIGKTVQQGMGGGGVPNVPMDFTT